uniref:Uncharacterized protein n=1 Tax=Rhizophora mucronata TaxID=61149 RepID=A0A2P2KNZ5_RHIMU
MSGFPDSSFSFPWLHPKLYLLPGSSRSFLTSSGRLANLGERFRRFRRSKENPGTSVTERIPNAFGPKPSSIFNDKSAFLSCYGRKLIRFYNQDSRILVCNLEPRGQWEPYKRRK